MTIAALIAALIPISLIAGLILYVRHLNRQPSDQPSSARDPSSKTPPNAADPHAPQHLPRPSDEVLQLIREGKTVEAAKAYRMETDLGLLESKRVVEHYARQ